MSSKNTHQDKEAVVMIHGLWLNGMDMSLLKKRMIAAGYYVKRFSYQSLTASPDENARTLQSFINELGYSHIHFVCHSLGGLVVRHLFNRYPDQKPGKVVTLGTPHNASQAARQFYSLPFGGLMLGQSITHGLLGSAPPWTGSHSLGSIAGTLRLGLGMIMPGIPRPNDGTVAVSETQLDGMVDHVTVDASHFGLLLSKKVAEHSIQFIKNGQFNCG